MESWFSNVEQLIAQNPLLALPAAFAAGFFVSLTPCVYPVVPLTLGFIGARTAGSRWKGFTLSLVYVTGMALTYAVLGAFAALTGRLFGQIAANPWVYLAVANVCLLLGLSMLGVFELPQVRLGAGKAPPAGKRGYLSVFFVGVLAGLIVGPCTAPVLAAILVYVGSKQNLVYGFLLLLAFGYGLGLLFVALGTFSALITSLPKSGQWLERVKKGFGWALVFSAEYLFIKTGGLF